MRRSDQLRQEIRQKAAEFTLAAHQRKPFVPCKTRIHYAGRVYDERELIAFVDASLDFWVTTGKSGMAFEEALAAYLGASHAVMLNSGSSANLAVLSALCTPHVERRLLPGDEVVTSAATFPTVVAPRLMRGMG